MTTINKAKVNSQSNNKQLELFNPSKPLELNFIQKKFTFIDFFAGIGGFRIPLEKLGGKCLGYSEIDKEAIKVYQKNFIGYYNAEELNLGDISKINHLPNNIDLFVGGVPCQPWSVAGKLKGFNDPRGQLWFDVIKLVNKYQPKAFIFENVKGLTNPKNRESFDFIIEQLEIAGYFVTHKILNAYDFGLPQDRDRVFIVGISKKLDNHDQFSFPEPLKLSPKLYDFISGIDKKQVNKKKFNPDTLFNGKIPVSRGRFQKIDELNDFFLFSDLRNGHTTIHSWDLISTTEREKQICQIILKNRRKKKYGGKDGNPLSLPILQELLPNLQEFELKQLIKKNILRVVKNSHYDFVNSKISSGINGISKIFLPHSDVIGTLTATGTRDYVATKSFTCQCPDSYKKEFIKQIYQKHKYKSLSSQDYAKLQGFPDWFVLSKNENIAKKQLGNAVPVPVIYHLVQSLLKILT